MLGGLEVLVRRLRIVAFELWFRLWQRYDLMLGVLDGTGPWKIDEI